MHGLNFIVEMVVEEEQDAKVKPHHQNQEDVAQPDQAAVPFCLFAVNNFTKSFPQRHSVGHIFPKVVLDYNW